MKEEIKQLLDLQKRDAELDRLQAETATIPAKIEALKKKIQDNRIALESSKKELIQFQLTKKQKDLDLDARESAIRKHSNELNAVKSNDAYKALMGEIDKAKRERSVLEDEVLQLMEQIDGATRTWKEREAASKGIEDGFSREISGWEAKREEVEAQRAAKSGERESFSGSLPKPLIAQYDRLRIQGKKSSPVVPIFNEQCGGCHMTVSPNLVNELRRGKMLTCEMCSRIVYLEDAPAEPQAAKAE